MDEMNKLYEEEKGKQKIPTQKSPKAKLPFIIGIVATIVVAIAIIFVCFWGSKTNDKQNQGNNNSSNENNFDNNTTARTPSLGFVFELNEDENGYIITDYMGGEVDICIPATYNGLPVTDIDSNTFNRVSDTLVSVCYADNMQIDGIHSSGFDDCLNLKSVIIPNGVTYIGENSFINCTSLESITIPDSVQRIEASAFSGCINLKNIYIGENSSLQEISGSAFNGCEKLKFNEYSNALYLGNESNPYTILYKAKNIAISSCSINEKTRIILDGAFSGCSGISEIVIPNSVEFIGLGAFAGCEGLTYNTYDNAYYIGSESNPYLMLIKSKDKTISSCVIHNDTEYICEYAFSKCENLTGITIPKNVKCIGEYAFYQCTAMTRINYNAQKTEVFASSVFSSAGSNTAGITAIIGADVEEIPSYFSGYDNFGNKSKLVKVIFEQGSSCKKIGHHAFYYSPTLQSIELPESIVTIGESAFIYCTALKNIVIPNSVKEIEEFAFCKCSGLISITLGNGIETIGTSAFRGCTALSNITIPSSVRNIGSAVFSDCTNLRNVTIMPGVTCIGRAMFEDCSNLKNIEIPNSVTEVGSSAFSGCTSLVCNEYDNACYIGTDSNPYFILIKAKEQKISSCIVHKDTKFIESYAFQDCKALINVKLGNSVTNIGFKAFDGCTKLEAVYIDNLDNWCDIIFESQTSNPVALAENLYVNEQLVVDLIIPTGTKEIGDYAFFFCRSIQSVKIPSSVESIGVNAFYGSTNIASVYIDDIAKWCSISFGSGSSNPLYYGDLYIKEQKTENLVIPDGVTEIAKAAFAGCKTIQTVALPSTVVHIGEGAFMQCTNLHEINLPDSIVSMDSGVFAVCEQLNSVTIPKNITYIPKYTFAGCTGLKQITISKDSKIARIGEDAFEECSSLEAVHIPDIATWCNIQFDETSSNPITYSQNLYIEGVLVENLIVPEGVESIGEAAFAGYQKLISVTIPNSVKSIGNYAFYECDNLSAVYINNLTKWCDISFGNRYSNPLYYGEDFYLNNVIISTLTIPEEVTMIKDYAFYQCQSITNVVIHDGVVKIGNYAFSNCNNIENVDIDTNSNLVDIGASAFEECTSLKKIIVPSNICSIGDNCYHNCLSVEEIIFSATNWNYYENQVFDTVGTAGSGITVTISANVLKIPAYLFNPQKWGVIHPKIKTVTFEEGSVCESIGEYAFSGCTSLTSVTIGDSVTSIGDRAFNGCTSLESVAIPDSVTSIGEGAFYNCTSLVSATIGDSVTRIGTYAFVGCSSLVSVTIGDSVTKIGISAFSGCTSLIEVCNKSSLNITAGSNDYGDVGYHAKHIITNESQSHLRYVGDYVFYDDGTDIYLVKYIGSDTEIILPESYGGKEYKISPRAFNYNDKITKVTIPDSITRIDDVAFQNCTSLESIVIPDSVTSIGINAFNGCTSLESVAIPDSVTSIGISAFEGCTSLKSITIPDSVTSIGNSAFFGCRKLTIYCEAESRPNRWHANWNKLNYSNQKVPVVWGYTGE